LVVGCVVDVDPFALPHTPLVPASGERQSATPPPLLPRHAHAHGPVPDTGLAVPVAHRFVDGAALAATPFAGPHCLPVLEFTGAEHCTVVPVPLPAQLQFQGPVPVTADAIPSLHRLPAGATVVITPFAGPHCPFTGATGAEQLADVPPPIPAQLQFHGPVPVTADAVPALHRPPEGAVSAVTPFAGPQAPFACTGAEHCAVLPPKAPTHSQLHGPVPLKLATVPDAHRLTVGCVATPTPFALPHAPFAEGGLAAHCAVVPPKLPAHVQFHGPLPATADATPALHRLPVGAEVCVVCAADPHVPFTAPGLAVQITVAPPALPRQSQPHGPLPITGDAVPALHNPLVGFDPCAVCAAGPHAPLTLPLPAIGASHCAAMPPLLPAQLHVHGPMPATADCVPALHKLATGALAAATPLAFPQAPFTGVAVVEALFAEHTTVPDGLVPEQVHSHGPLPFTADAVPTEHSPVAGAALSDAPFADPHTPLVSACARFAEHCAVVPLLLPAQLQFHGPVPVTAEAVPALHRLAVGALATVVPPALPYTPFTGGGVVVDPVTWKDAVFVSSTVFVGLTICSVAV
jgi:hypothetical protein